MAPRAPLDRRVAELAGRCHNVHGRAHDARLAAPLIAQQQSTRTNPAKHALLVDTGYTGVGTATPPAIFRPLKSELIPADSAALFRAFSAYMTVRRQAVEWANGALKRLAPRILVAMRLEQREKYRLVFENCAAPHQRPHTAHRLQPAQDGVLPAR